MNKQPIVILVVALAFIAIVYSQQRAIKSAIKTTFRGYMHLWEVKDPTNASIDIISTSKEKNLTIKKPKDSSSSLQLSNEVIDKTIAEYAENMAKCHKNRIPAVGELKGQILIGIDIAPSGKVSSVKIIQTEIKDEVLLKCLVSIFYSIQLPRFEGTHLQRAYPVVFQ